MIIDDYIPLFKKKLVFQPELFDESWKKQRSLHFVSKAVAKAKEDIELGNIYNTSMIVDYLNNSFYKYSIIFQLTFKQDWDSEKTGRALIIYVPHTAFTIDEEQFVSEIQDQIIIQSEIG